MDYYCDVCDITNIKSRKNHIRSRSQKQFDKLIRITYTI